MTKVRIFIDGEAGTTGLEIRERLGDHPSIELISIESAKRKDKDERAKLLNTSDLAVLCLPDEAARESVALISNPSVRILDASSAHRTAPSWTYGFPELNAPQKEQIKKSKRVSNPGCYATGAIALIRPLVDAGIIPVGYGLTLNAVSGYSGGGKELIALCEHPDGSDRSSAFCLYGLDQNHKHLPEIRLHGGLQMDPIFLPSYSSSFYRGMLVTMALRFKELKNKTGKNLTSQYVYKALREHYKGSPSIEIENIFMPLEKHYVLTPFAMNNSNKMRLSLFTNTEKETIVLTACLDNLGKGAAGAAVQNIEIMFGL